MSLQEKRRIVLREGVKCCLVWCEDCEEWYSGWFEHLCPLWINMDSEVSHSLTA